MMKRYLIFALALSMFLPLTARAEGQQAMLVLDASGSMWGQINGKSKIEIAREVIADVLKGWNPDTRLGLIAYGHRNKSDCEDIETLIRTGPLDATAFNKVVAGIQPKGMTPISAAVIRAADALQYSREKATVILVSDGQETCHADPCKTASELEKRGVDFTMHVIGFDVSDKQGQQQLRCMADNTGGRFFTAANAADLKQALSTAVKQVEEAKPDPNAPGNLLLTTVLAEGTPPLNVSECSIYSQQGDAGRQQVDRHVTHATEHVFKLPPGQYIATCSYGSASAEKQVSIMAGKGVGEQLVLNAGELNMHGVLHAGGDPVNSDDYRIYRETTDASGKTIRQQFAFSNLHNTKVHFTLPAGDYIAAMSYGKTSAEQKIHIEAGKTEEIELNLHAGTLRLHGVLHAGGDPLNSDDYRIYRETTDASGKTVRQQIAFVNLHYTNVTFTLSAGDYIAFMGYGQASAEQKVHVEEGKAQEIELNLHAGRLHITPLDAPGGKPLNIDDYRIYRETTDEFGKTARRQVSYVNMHYTNVTFTLPDGDYIAVVSHRGLEVEKAVHVEEGKSVDVEIVLARKHYDSPVGTWNSSGGRLELNAKSGDRFEGHYSTDNGRLILQRDGSRMSGYWVEDGSSQTCASKRDGSLHWGRIELQFNSDNNGFSGWWSYCDSSEHSGDWGGERN
ncbi:MAG: hypothetical protein AUJ58_01150 [Zetaproteobacteria bacterium CG1_02_55_237]|nr:MAG: hypothetical protein AUJ58_01150 [Zetaproteobacteria bacterium CG1_02_55_237]